MITVIRFPGGKPDSQEPGTIREIMQRFLVPPEEGSSVVYDEVLIPPEEWDSYHVSQGEVFVLGRVRGQGPPAHWVCRDGVWLDPTLPGNEEDFVDTEEIA